MKREEKNVLSRQRILDAAMQEFAEKGYDGASLNTVCIKYEISKGMIYHYFKDKDELYMNCVALCFNEATAYLKQMLAEEEFTPKKQLRKYFDARTAFFVKNPLMLGIFANAAFHPPIALSAQIKACRQEFDALNKAVLTAFLNSQQLRKGFSAEMIIDEFSIYMDFFNTRFKTDFSSHDFSEKLIYEHEERSHRQLDILLNGVLGKENE